MIPTLPRKNTNSRKNINVRQPVHTQTWWTCRWHRRPGSSYPKPQTASDSCPDLERRHRWKYELFSPPHARSEAYSSHPAAPKRTSSDSLWSDLASLPFIQISRDTKTRCNAKKRVSGVLKVSWNNHKTQKFIEEKQPLLFSVFTAFEMFDMRAAVACLAFRKLRQNGFLVQSTGLNSSNIRTCCYSSLVIEYFSVSKATVRLTPLKASAADRRRAQLHINAPDLQINDSHILNVERRCRGTSKSF